MTGQGLILLASGLRALVTGFTGVTLGLYLAQLGVGARDAGFVIGAGLAGLAAATAVVALKGETFDPRRALIITTLLSAAGLAAVTLSAHTDILAAAACLGLVNGMGRDRGPAQTVEQSILADQVRDEHRTRLFTRYTIVQDVAGALGSWAAAVPAALESLGGVPVLTGYRVTFWAAAVIAAVPALLYARLAPSGGGPRTRLSAGGASPETRRRVASLSALFALDSIGGGFLAGSILSYWFFQRFGLTGAVLGPLFLAARGLNAVSYLGAEWLSRRIGLVATMVYTHVPSSLLLLCIPLAPDGWIAATLFLLRESLVQMDVPVRQSYVAAITAPGERTYALGVTGIVRNVGWATGPPGAGWAMQSVGLGAPLVLGASFKIVYDLLLYRRFRHLWPPEERGQRGGGAGIAS